MELLGRVGNHLSFLSYQVAKNAVLSHGQHQVFRSACRVRARCQMLVVHVLGEREATTLVCDPDD